MLKNIVVQYIDYKNELYLYKVSILDSKFIEDIILEIDAKTPIDIIIATAIIEHYSKRKLNLAKNLFLMLCLYEAKYNWDIADQLNFYVNSIPQYKDYLSDIKKYLLFI